MKSITILAPTGQKIDEHAIAIEHTAKMIPHQTKKLLLSPRPPGVSYSGDWKMIPEWMPEGHWTLYDYNRFMLFGLANYVQTEVCISVHWDGYGVHADRWTDEFLEFDYIGAPWPPRLVSNQNERVGNGGFSLRSKHWLETGKGLEQMYRGEPEDVFCCQIHPDFYRSHGCRIAPIDVALRFSVEIPIPEYPHWPTTKSFGFHGWFNSDRDKFRIILPNENK